LFNELDKAFCVPQKALAANIRARSHFEAFLPKV
jgi:hypothetical protein